MGDRTDVVRMKYSELLSNSMSFVTERAHWDQHKRSWRREEVRLLATVQKIKEVSVAPVSDIDTEERFRETRGAGARATSNQNHRDEQEKRKDEQLESLEKQGLYAFIDSRAHAQNSAADNLAEDLVAMGLNDETLALKFAEDLVNCGCDNLNLMRQLMEVSYVGKGRYPFGNVRNEDMFPSESDKTRKRLLEYLSIGGVTVLAAIKGKSSGAEPEPEPEPELGDSISRPVSPDRQRPIGTSNEFVSGALGRSAAQERMRLQVENDRQVEDDRQRCMAMLKVLSTTLDQEYIEGGRAHWGSEDRRTKMWFISLTRPLLMKVVLVIVGQFMAAILGGSLKALTN